MADGFRVDPAVVAARARDFDDLSSQAGAIHRELADKLAAAGPAWGDDAVGASFAAAHTTPADAALADVQALRTALSDTGSRFAATAEAYTRVEDHNAANLTAPGE